MRFIIFVFVVGCSTFHRGPDGLSSIHAVGTPVGVSQADLVDAYAEALRAQTRTWEVCMTDPEQCGHYGNYYYPYLEGPPGLPGDGGPAVRGPVVARYMTEFEWAVMLTREYQRAEAARRSAQLLVDNPPPSK